MSLPQLINEIAVKMDLYKVRQEAKNSEKYTEREILLLELIDVNKRMTVSEITSNFKVVSKSIVSSTISNFWKADIVNKDKDKENQRMTYVSLTSKGKKVLNAHRKNQNERFAFLIEAFDLSSEEKDVFERILKRAIDKIVF